MVWGLHDEVHLFSGGRVVVIQILLHGLDELVEVRDLFVALGLGARDNVVSEHQPSRDQFVVLRVEHL